MAAEPGPVLHGHVVQRDLPFLQRIAREIGRLASDRVAFLTAGDGEQGAFLLCAGDRATMDLATAGRKVAEILEGRGGGSGRVFQGKATALSRRTEALAWLQGQV
jgi:misacylated tRNA(Ala) deacylase